MSVIISDQVVSIYFWLTRCGAAVPLDFRGDASVCPDNNFSTQRCLAGNTAIEELAGENLQLNFNHIAPIAMLWCMANIETVKDQTRFLQDLCRQSTSMSIEIIHGHKHFPYGLLMQGQELLYLHPTVHKTIATLLLVFARMFPFTMKAGHIHGLYHKFQYGGTLKEHEFVVNADQKASIQACAQRLSNYPAQPGSSIKSGHEYTRCEALSCITVLDVHRTKPFSFCEHKSGFGLFDRLVGQSIGQDPHKEARRVFLIADNGSVDRGLKFDERLGITSRASKWVTGRSQSISNIDLPLKILIV